MKLSRLIKLVVWGLVGAAVAQELRTPADERKWHGTVGGVVPYDFRVPGPDKLRRAWWDPNGPLINPTVRRRMGDQLRPPPGDAERQDRLAAAVRRGGPLRGFSVRFTSLCGFVFTEKGNCVAPHPLSGPEVTQKPFSANTVAHSATQVEEKGELPRASARHSSFAAGFQVSGGSLRRGGPPRCRGRPGTSTTELLPRWTTPPERGGTRRDLRCLPPPRRGQRSGPGTHRG